MFGKGSPDKFYDHDDVRKIADEIIRFRTTELLKFARMAMLSDKTSVVEDQFALHLGSNPEYVESARRIASAGSRILNSPQKGNLRGALVSRVVCELVAIREPTADTEVTIDLKTGVPSNPQDVVARGDPVEVYECKASANLVDQGDLNELTSIRNALSTNGFDAPRCGVVALSSRFEVEARLSELRIRGRLYWACEDDIVGLWRSHINEAA